ncbi:hypothetical protein EB241_18880 [Erwinia psidii]|uniref:Uncharacterized protein n=1 Tax=Erwinia psidii TaxID=69224 RepID=A0A3N6S9I3_9GAMM|nr:hypothetical protein EB241_18880 [Erwinia psidii]
MSGFKALPSFCDTAGIMPCYRLNTFSECLNAALAKNRIDRYEVLRANEEPNYGIKCPVTL